MSDSDRANERPADADVAKVHGPGAEESAGLPGPVVPGPEVRAEFERYLDADESALGDVWRRTRAGESPDDIRLARGAERSTFVWSYQRIARAMIEGSLPTAPTVALSVARRFRAILSAEVMSPEAENILRTNLVVLEERAASEVSRKIEDQQALEVTEVAEAEAVPGIYVYALPHYLRYPYDEESGRTC